MLMCVHMHVLACLLCVRINLCVCVLYAYINVHTCVCIFCVLCVCAFDILHDLSTDHPQMWPPVTGTLAPYDHPFNHQMNPQMQQSHPPPYHHCESVCVLVLYQIRFPY